MIQDSHLSIDIDRSVTCNQGHWQKLSSVLISVCVHALLCVCCLYCFDFPIAKHGTEAGDDDGPLRLTTTFSSEETLAAGRTGGEVTMAALEFVAARDGMEAIKPISPVAHNDGEDSTHNSDDAPSQEVATDDAAAMEPVVQPGSRRPLQRKYGHLLQQAVVNASLETEAGSPRTGTTGGTGTGRSGSPTTAGTSFFDISAEGNLFCYVVDSSSSMDEGGAIDLARAELMASIEQLQAKQRFQLLFYDSELHPLWDRGKQTFFATDESQKLARQFILSQQTHGGTVHRPALLAALRMSPEVIYFLTDGETPELSGEDLQTIKQANRRRTRIHVIQFGRGAKLASFSWLEQLARDHRGSYRYHDVSP